jgi:hypothetical protein
MNHNDKQQLPAIGINKRLDYLNKQKVTISGVKEGNIFIKVRIREMVYIKVISC